MKTCTLLNTPGAYRLLDENNEPLQRFPWKTLAERDRAKGEALRLAVALGFSRVEKKNDIPKEKMHPRVKKKRINC